MDKALDILKGIWKKFTDNELAYVEMFLVSFFTAIFVNAITTDSYKMINEVGFMESKSLISTIYVLACITTLALIIYSFKPIITKLLMFISMYTYFILCAYYTKDFEWNAGYSNTVVRCVFFVVLTLISALAFFYIKDEVFAIIKRIKMTPLVRNIIISIIGVLICGFISYITILRYLTYSNATFDFGIFAQMYEYMAQKGTVYTTCEREFLLSHFAVHFSPIFYITLPIYLIHRTPETIQVIQAIMVALPVLPILLLGKHYKLSNWVTIALVMMYALFPATVGGTLYDIHENCFMTFLLLMLIYACEKNCNWAIVVIMILTAMVKEDAGMYILILGLYFIFSRRDKVKGAFFVVFGAALFVVATEIVNSYGLGVLDDRFADYFFGEKQSVFQIVQIAFTHPGFIFSQMVKSYSFENTDKLLYILEFVVPLAPVLFSIKKKYSRYILMVPLLLVNLATTYAYMHDIGFHYNFATVAFLFYVIIMNLSEVDTKEAASRVSICVLCCGLFFAGLMYQNATFMKNLYETNSEMFQRLDAGIEMVPEGASVSTTGNLLPHMADHLILYEHNIYKGDRNEVPLTDYYVVDMRGNDLEYFEEDINNFGYTLIYDDPGAIAVYQRTES